MRIQLLSPDNGVGLTKDRNILQSIFTTAGYEVLICDPLKSQPQKADINIHLEIPYYQSFRSANKNILFPNPEWFQRSWTRQLRLFNLVCAKTRDCERIFKKLHPNVEYTSFTSEDKFDPDSLPRVNRFIHFAGKSSAKGTAQVIQAFEKMYNDCGLNEPEEVAIYYHGGITYKHSTPNIHLYKERPEEYQFKQLQNAYRFHLCPSYYEGFGHYINEAKSVGAIILTTNAAPMNELCEPSYSFGVAWDKVGAQGYGTLFYPSVKDIIEQVKVINSLVPENIELFGGRARESFLKNDKWFKEKILQVIKGL